MKTVVIDTEISGPEPTDQVIELGFVTKNKKSSILYGLPDDLDLHFQNVQLTGITKEMLRGRAEFSGLPEEMNDKVWVSYNVQHDINWLNHTLKIYGLPELKNVPSLCLAELIMSHFNLAYPIKMEEALDRLKLDAKVQHRALPDALKHVEILNEIVRTNPAALKGQLRKRNPQAI